MKRIPWKRLFDVAFGVADIARGPDRRDVGPVEQHLTAGPAPAPGYLEARLTGVVVAALREAFDRDTRRLELERQQMEAERAHAERALALERSRQTGEREIGRLRLIAGVAVASWLGTLLFATRLAGAGTGVRVTIAIGWMLILAALASSFFGQARVAQVLERRDETDRPHHEVTSGLAASSGLAGTLAPWLVVAGLAMTGAALMFL